MKKVIIDVASNQTINLVNILETTPIFAKRNCRWAGMVVKEDHGWILRIGGACGSNGHHSTRAKCMIKASELGYAFFTEGE